MNRAGNNYVQNIVAKRCETAILEVKSAGAVTVSGDSGASGLSVADYKEGLLLINTTAVSGTTPQAAFTLQTSDGMGNWYNLPVSVPNVTAAGKTIVPVTNFGETIKLVWTVTGTTPSINFMAMFVAKS